VATCAEISIKYVLLRTVYSTVPFVLASLSVAAEAACTYEPNVNKCDYDEETHVCSFRRLAATTATTTTTTVAVAGVDRATTTTLRATTALSTLGAPAPPPPSPSPSSAGEGTTTTTAKKKSGMSGGVIAGIAVGGLAAVAGIAMAIKHAKAGSSYSAVSTGGVKTILS
jgi:hypothetical protein